MNATEWQFGWVVAAAVLGSIAGAWIAQRAGWRRQQALSAAALDARIERLERELRQTIDASADRASMQIGARVAQLQDALTAHVTQITGVQAEQLGGYGRVMQQQLADLTAAIQRQPRRGAKRRWRRGCRRCSRAMRRVWSRCVPPSRRSFRPRWTAVSANRSAWFPSGLEQVHRGLGEMQALAAGVGDLKRVLGNVKSRGVFGEVQLAALLEQVLLADQYAANVATRPGSSDRVDFAIRLPGRNGDNRGVAADRRQVSDRGLRSGWSPPRSGPMRPAPRRLARALEKPRARRVAHAARKVRRAASHDRFCVLFLPTEGLFRRGVAAPGPGRGAEPGAARGGRGPHHAGCDAELAADGISNARDRGSGRPRSGRCWRGEDRVCPLRRMAGAVREQVGTVSRTLEQADTRTKQMQRKLREVEALPAEQAVALLPAAPRDEEEE